MTPAAEPNIVVFLGPTIPREEAERLLPARYLPPVARGDVYRAALDRPGIIAIIDGRFDSVPSVLHKEILWAMAAGIHVFGASSMGALRAAELEAFGMVGVGRVFEGFRQGTLVADDEVAVIHAPAELGFAPLSEALVDIRATLAGARSVGLIGEEQEASLTRVARSLFFPRRTYEDLIGQSDLNARERAALAAWLVSSKRSQKREDAIALLKMLALRGSRPARPKDVDYEFVATEAWTMFIGEQTDGQPAAEPLSPA